MDKINIQLNNLKNQALKCQNCGLYKTRKNVVFSDGFEKAPIMFIGEAPGKNEDEKGIPFIGRAGRLLRKFLSEVGIGQNDFYIANTIKCRPPKNRKPTQIEKNACRCFLDKQIELVNPKIVVLVGSTALESFVSDKKLTITKARGNVFEIDNRKFMPIFHPSYLLRHHSVEENSPRDLFKKDLSFIKNEVLNNENH